MITAEVGCNVQKRPKRHLPEGIDSRGSRRQGEAESPADACPGQTDAGTGLGL